MLTQIYVAICLYGVTRPQFLHYVSVKEMDFHENKPEVGMVVKTVTEVSCCLSIVGSLLIIVSYCLWHDLRTKARRIVVFLSVADLISAVAYLYGSLRAFKSETWDCIAQSAVSTYSNIASFLWTISVAIYIYMLIVKLDQDYGGSSLLWFHIVNWGIPLVIVIAALSAGGLGWDQSYVSVGWCWVDLSNEQFMMWMLLAGKIWEIAAYIMLPVIYCLIKVHIYQKVRGSKAAKTLGLIMRTSCHRNAFCITGPLWGESTSDRWVPLTKGQLCGTLMLAWTSCWTNYSIQVPECGFYHHRIIVVDSISTAIF